MRRPQNDPPMPRIVEDPDVPPGEVRFVSDSGDVVGKIVNIGEPDAPVEVADRPWLEMKDAPRDGTLIEYEDVKYARYRITRRRMDRRWKTIGFWADAFTAEEMEPARWRLPEGFALPGMVMA